MLNAPIFLICFFAISITCFGQNEFKIKKQVNAIRIEAPPKIDGFLDDEVWKSQQVATDFVQQAPTPGGKSFQKTEVRILYDNTAMYVGAMMYESSADSVSRALVQRDGIGAADFFAFIVDPYQDGINGLEFIVTAAGVQFDAKMSTNGEDTNWDAVWQSEVQIHENGWSVEYKIPYSALRFPDKPVQKWGLNLLRSTYRNGERTWWSELKPEVSGFLNQAGELVGLEDIKPPVRLSFSPFVSLNFNHFPQHQPGVKNISTGFNAGMDIKYGINEAFTLDMTLVPDFGQVQSDNQILNLSPFETFFNENRQFFTEGTELFSKADIFYSRRIGGRPTGFFSAQHELDPGETLVDNPSEIQLINSTKISGRNQKGLGIGVLNSVTARMYATAEDKSGNQRKILTEPLTNYNVVVLDQNLKHNSYISFINTNVLREGTAYEANVTATEFQIRNKENSYKLKGEFALSQKYFDGFNNPDLGYKAELGISKTSGNFNFRLEHDIINGSYDHNDLGFLSRNNYHSTELELDYNRYKPFGKIFRNQFNGLDFEYDRLYKPGHFTDFGILMYSYNNFTNFWWGELWTYLVPVRTFDFYEPRMDGRFFKDHRNYNFGGNLGTDQRKKIGAFFSWNTRFWDSGDRKRLNFTLSPRFQVSNKLKFNLEFGSYNFLNDIGYATTEGNNIIFGRRDQLTVENSFSGSYTFNPRMWITLRVRHYWSEANYKEFFLLDEDGELTETEYSGVDIEGNPLHNVNFNAFNVDMAYKWRFAPGSEISLVWKNSILSFDRDVHGHYFDNLGNIFKNDQNNLISVKVLYYLDYLYFKKKN